MDSKPPSETDKKSLYKLAFGLALFTIVYNIAEGFVSAFFGYKDESLTLLGFGIDSFIEMISGLGIANMILRIQKQPNSSRDNFEKTALQITGFSFYVLTIGLITTSLYNIWIEHKPETTFWGILISIFSIVIMWILIMAKKRVGKKLNSDAIIADAECTKVCLYMSFILLISSLLYELTNLNYIDSIGTFGLAYFSFKEGKECFEKIMHNTHCSCEK